MDRMSSCKCSMSGDCLWSVERLMMQQWTLTCCSKAVSEALVSKIQRKVAEAAAICPFDGQV